MPVGRTSKIEIDGMNLASPWMPENRFFVEGSGRNVAFFQTQVGDYLTTFDFRGARYFRTIEVKSEAKWTGNFFIEFWSNLSERTPGWIQTLWSDYLWCVFLDNQHQYVISLPDFRDWAFADNGRAGKFTLDDHLLVQQEKYSQTNDTWGNLVPIDVVRREVGFIAEIHGNEVKTAPPWKLPDA